MLMLILSINYKRLGFRQVFSFVLRQQGDGRNFSRSNKGVYVCFVINFTINTIANYVDFWQPLFSILFTFYKNFINSQIHSYSTTNYAFNRGVNYENCWNYSRGCDSFVFFLFYILSLMQLVPLIIAGPLLFLAILIIFTLLNNHNKFRDLKMKQDTAPASF